jgi:hypothetical protein
MGGRGQTISYSWYPNPYDAYPDDRSKNWIRARSKLVIKDRVAVIVFNNKEAEKLAADIKEKIACAESSGWQGRGSMMC